MTTTEIKWFETICIEKPKTAVESTNSLPCSVRTIIKGHVVVLHFIRIHYNNTYFDAPVETIKHIKPRWKIKQRTNCKLKPLPSY